MSVPNVGDILRITAFQTLLGQQCVNVYFYRVESPVNPQATLFETAESWALYFNTQVMQALSNKVTLDRVLIENLTDGINFSDVTVSYVGAEIGEVLPPFNAIAVKLARGTKQTRNGSKRLVGVPESTCENGVLTWGQAKIDLVENFHTATIVFDDLNEGASKQYFLENVIVGRSLEFGSYVLDLSLINPVIDAAVDLNVTSQLSRKA